MNEQRWWLSCRHFTIRAVVRRGVLVDLPPILRRHFLNRPFLTLIVRMKQLGGFRMERLDEQTEPRVCRRESRRPTFGG